MKLPPLSRWLLAYGAFVLTMGVLGYLSNPEKAGTALKSGGTVAVLSVVWAFGWAARRRWALYGAATTLGLLSLVFAWRSTASWMAFAGGDSQKLTAALLITAMLIATGVTLPQVIKEIRASRPGPA